MLKRLVVLLAAGLALSGPTFAKSYSSKSSSSKSSLSSKSSSSSDSSSSSSSDSSSSKKKSYRSKTSSSSSTPTTSSWKAVSDASAKQQSASRFQDYKAKQSASSPSPASFSSSPSTPPASARTVYVQSPSPQIVVHHYVRDNSGYWDGMTTAWLMQQSLDTRAAWLYNRRAELSDSQYQQLVANNAELQAKVDSLKAQGVAPSPSNAPPPSDEVQPAPEEEKSSAGFWIVAGILLLAVAGVTWWRYFQ